MQKRYVKDNVKIKSIELGRTDIDTKMASFIPQAFAEKYCIVPVGFLGEKIIVAMANPVDLYTVDDIKTTSGYDVEPVNAAKSDIERAIAKLYEKHSAIKAAEDLSCMPSTDNKKIKDDIIDEVNSAPAVRLVNSIISQSIKERASDIHIEPFENHVRIRLRVDGRLQEMMSISKAALLPMVTRIKVMADMDIAEKRIPQDGRIRIENKNENVDLRVSILPTAFGEKIVIRLLNRNNFVLSLRELGLYGDNLKKVQNYIKCPYGIILITGPTGSGKSTTLIAMLNELNTMEKNIVTVEDPIEYMMEGINQVQVNEKTGLTFASGLRSILRQDPDIIMIGEIRDSETAQIAVRAAITGHLVLSTLHTNDAPSAVTRLSDMGIEPFLVASSLKCAIAQRLVRKICPNCKYEYNAGIDDKKALDIDVSWPVKLYRGSGCSMCSGTGYLSRLGIYEIMEFTKEHREAVMRNAGIDEMKEISIINGMKSLKQSCSELVLSGETTMDEFIRIAFTND